MASTGEIASFGKDMAEAYWAAMCSQTGFRVPEPKKGVLMGGDVTKPEFPEVATRLYDMGFKLYCSDPAVEAFLNDLPRVRAQRIYFPLKDKRKLREVFDEYDIQFVINLAKQRASTLLDQDYVARRNAVDFGLPLINNAACAKLWCLALEHKMKQRGGLSGWEEGKLPAEVKSWREWVPHS
jgi:carbamoyl-phosphate synthase large subunit